jgi:hypothetical protein
MKDDKNEEYSLQLDSLREQLVKQIDQVRKDLRDEVTTALQIDYANSLTGEFDEINIALNRSDMKELAEANSTLSLAVDYLNDYLSKNQGLDPTVTANIEKITQLVENYRVFLNKLNELYDLITIQWENGELDALGEDKKTSLNTMIKLVKDNQETDRYRSQLFRLALENLQGDDLEKLKNQWPELEKFERSESRAAEERAAKEKIAAKKRAAKEKIAAVIQKSMDVIREERNKHCSSKILSECRPNEVVAVINAQIKEVDGFGLDQETTKSVIRELKKYQEGFIETQSQKLEKHYSDITKYLVTDLPSAKIKINVNKKENFSEMISGEANGNYFDAVYHYLLTLDKAYSQVSDVMKHNSDMLDDDQARSLKEQQLKLAKQMVTVVDRLEVLNNTVNVGKSEKEKGRSVNYSKVVASVATGNLMEKMKERDALRDSDILLNERTAYLEIILQNASRQEATSTPTLDMMRAIKDKASKTIEEKKVNNLKQKNKIFQAFITAKEKGGDFSVIDENTSRLFDVVQKQAGDVTDEQEIKRFCAAVGVNDPTIKMKEVNTHLNKLLSDLKTEYSSVFEEEDYEDFTVKLILTGVIYFHSSHEKSIDDFVKLFKIKAPGDVYIDGSENTLYEWLGEHKEQLNVISKKLCTVQAQMSDEIRQQLERPNAIRDFKFILKTQYGLTDEQLEKIDKASIMTYFSNHNLGNLQLLLEGKWKDLSSVLTQTEENKEDDINTLVVQDEQEYDDFLTQYNTYLINIVDDKKSGLSKNEKSTLSELDEQIVEYLEQKTVENKTAIKKNLTSLVNEFDQSEDSSKQYKAIVQMAEKQDVRLGLVEESMLRELNAYGSFWKVKRHHKKRAKELFLCLCNPHVDLEAKLALIKFQLSCYGENTLGKDNLKLGHVWHEKIKTQSANYITRAFSVSRVKNPWLWNKQNTQGAFHKILTKLESEYNKLTQKKTNVDESDSDSTVSERSSDDEDQKPGMF